MCHMLRFVQIMLYAMLKYWVNQCELHDCKPVNLNEKREPAGSSCYLCYRTYPSAKTFKQIPPYLFCWGQSWKPMWWILKTTYMVHRCKELHVEQRPKQDLKYMESWRWHFLEIFHKGLIVLWHSKSKLSEQWHSQSLDSCGLVSLKSSDSL